MAELIMTFILPFTMPFEYFSLVFHFQQVMSSCSTNPVGWRTQKRCFRTYNTINSNSIELSSREVIPLDGAIIRVPTVFSCIETAIWKS